METERDGRSCWNYADGEGRWEVRFGDYNILHLLELRDGSVLLTRLDVLTEGETVLYDPRGAASPQDRARPDMERLRQG